MFQGLQKIGKTKHKYKARITFIKISNESTEKGLYFKIVIQRGSHKIQTISQPCKKGLAKFSNQQYIIPMTLFCDDGAKQIKYLQKMGTIKVYEYDKKNGTTNKIGKKEIDWSQYANNTKLLMEIQIEQSILTISLFCQKQDDDSKSVQTYSSNNDKKQQKNSEEDATSINKQPKKQKYNGRTVNLEQKDDNSLEKQQKYNKNKSKQYSKQKNNNYDNNYTQQMKQKNDIQKQQKQINKISPSNNTSVIKSKKITNKNQKTPQPDSDQSQNQLNQQPDTSTSPPNKSTIPEFTDGQSSQLQTFLLKKTLKQKQLQINSLKKQNQALKKALDKLITQTTLTKQTQKKNNTDKQSEDIRKNIVNRDITIDQLTTTNTSLLARQDQYEKTILKLRQELINSKEKICDIKYREAFLMQSLFQLEDKEAIEEACRFLSV